MHMKVFGPSISPPQPSHLAAKTYPMLTNLPLQSHGITSPGLITPPIFKLATITLPSSVYEEILVIYFLLTPLCLPPQQLQLATPSDGQQGHSPGENCSTKAIAPPIFKLATKVIPSSIYEELLSIHYVKTSFCWPPLTLPSGG